MTEDEKKHMKKQAKVRKKLIRRLQEEAKEPMTAAEIREQVASYITAEMDDYPREKVDEYLDKNYGKICP